MSGRKLLLLVLAFAALLRVWGLGFGLPATLARPDEETVVAVALGVFQRHLNPHFFDWPAFYMYVVGLGYVAFFNVGRLIGWFPFEYDFLKWVFVHIWTLHAIGRVITALSGVSTVWVIYRAARRLSGEPTALFAALFLAVTPLHVRQSHFGTPDVMATLFVALAFLFAVHYRHDRTIRNVAIAALFTGLAAATKYNAGAIAIAPLVAIASPAGAAAWPAGARPNRVTHACVFIALTLAAFLAASPYVAIEWREFAASFEGVRQRMAGGQVVTTRLAWITHLGSSLRYGVGLPLLVSAAIGFLILVFTRGAEAVLVLSFPLLYFAILGSGRSAFARYMLPMMPFICLGAAVFAEALRRTVAERWTTPAARAVAASAIVVIVAATATWSDIQTDRLLQRDDTRTLAAHWVTARYPEGTAIGQSGSGYGRPQISDTRYQVSVFDAGSGAFRSDDGEVAARPRVLIVHRYPLAYSSVPASLDTVISSGYRLAQAFPALGTTGERLAFDEDDAFYLPVAGLRDVQFPGPDIAIYESCCPPEPQPGGDLQPALGTTK